MTHQLDLIDNAVQKFEAELDKLPLLKSRCLLSSSLLIDAINQLDVGIKATRWEGSLAVINATETEKLKRTPKAQFESSSVAVYANPQNLKESDTGGHVAVILEIDGEEFLIDPTITQFKRTRKQHGFTIYTPSVLTARYSDDSLKDGVYGYSHMFGKTEMIFMYRPEKMLRLTSETKGLTEKKNYEQLLKGMVAMLKHEGIK